MDGANRICRMPKKPEITIPESRYAYERATHEIDRALHQRGRGSRKAAAAACMLTASQFSKRMMGVERFSVEHFGLIADHLQAPPGWPFIPWELASEMSAAMREARNRKRS